MYALSAAAISHTIARACTSGDLRLCTCGPIPGDTLEPGHRWGGCADNLHYGLVMGSKFSDAPMKIKKKTGLSHPNKLMHLHNSEVGRQVTTSHLFNQTSPVTSNITKPHLLHQSFTCHTEPNLLYQTSYFRSLLFIIFCSNSSPIFSVRPSRTRWW